MLAFTVPARRSVQPAPLILLSGIWPENATASRFMRPWAGHPALPSRFTTSAPSPCTFAPLLSAYALVPAPGLLKCCYTFCRHPHSEDHASAVQVPYHPAALNLHRLCLILASPPPVHKPGFYLFHHLICSYSNRYLAPAILISTPSQISMISLFSSIWPPAMVPFVEFKSCT